MLRLGFATIALRRNPGASNPGGLAVTHLSGDGWGKPRSFLVFRRFWPVPGQRTSINAVLGAISGLHAVVSALSMGISSLFAAISWVSAAVYWL